MACAKAPNDHVLPVLVTPPKPKGKTQWLWDVSRVTSYESQSCILYFILHTFLSSSLVIARRPVANSITSGYTLDSTSLLQKWSYCSFSSVGTLAMPPAHYPKAPYTIGQGLIHSVLAAVGAISSDHPQIKPINPFARNDTTYRNIILVGQDADSEYRYLVENPHFNPYPFATICGILDNQRIYDWLHPGENNRGIEYLVQYCFPDQNVSNLHNAGNDAYWELRVCMHLLKELASCSVPESQSQPAFKKLWDVVFVAMDVEAFNGRKERLTVSRVIFSKPLQI